MCYYFRVVVEMSTEGTSNHSTKHNRSPTSRRRATERQRLWYQWNKDAINERRSILYHRRTRESTIEIDFPISRKYRSLADTLQCLAILKEMVRAFRHVSDREAGRKIRREWLQRQRGRQVHVDVNWCCICHKSGCILE